MQKLWTLKCDWDDPVPEDALAWWTRFSAQLPLLRNISINRWTQCGSDTLELALHGFADASTKAYAAVVYVRVISLDRSVHVALLSAKSRVAPLTLMTVPRLELSAVALLARLVKSVRDALGKSTVPCHCWMDSTIALAWLDKPAAT